jgi:glucosamine-6-phosphate deaminase
MRTKVGSDREAMARAAASDAAIVLRDALDRYGEATVMFATGNSQLDFLNELMTHHAVDWSRVTGFHMDEYLGIAADHRASFRRYMRENVASRVRFRAFHFIAGDAPDPEAECRRYAALMKHRPLDLCCLGIGENGHLAFNDPPADFEDPVDVKVVTLDQACRLQQVGEGHFAGLNEVPHRAITVTIPALLRASRVIAVVPEARKAFVVAAALEGDITADCPASILQKQGHVAVYLDPDSARLLEHDGVRPAVTPTRHMPPLHKVVSAEARLKELGIELPGPHPPHDPLDAVVVHRGTARTSGQLPRIAGELTCVGVLGDSVTVDEGYQAARICALNALSVLRAELGSLDRIDRVLTVTGYVASAPGFDQQPAVVDGASHALVEVFGDRGRHTRSAIGVAALPRRGAVEVEVTVSIKGDL